MNGDRMILWQRAVGGNIPTTLLRRNVHDITATGFLGKANGVHGKQLDSGAGFGTGGEAALFFHFLIAQFLPPDLDGEVGLPLGDDFFRRIGVLDDEVAGVAGHHHGLERTLCAATDLDHLVGSDEMVFQPLTAVDAGGFGLRDDGLKVTVVHITDHLGEVPVGPKFVARQIGAADGFKWGDVLAHGKEFAAVVGCRLSVVGGRWSVVGGRWSVVGGRACVFLSDPFQDAPQAEF